MAIDTLFAQNPTVINATYDKVWVSEIVISAPDLGGDAQARVLLRKFRTTESGAEFSPEPGEWITVDAILAGSESDPDLAAPNPVPSSRRSRASGSRSMPSWRAARATPTSRRRWAV